MVNAEFVLSPSSNNNIKSDFVCVEIARIVFGVCE
jgi:hypothetical protein